MRRRLALVAVAAMTLVAGAYVFLDGGDDRPSGSPSASVEDGDSAAGVLGCDVPLAILERTARGRYGRRSPEVVLIEQAFAQLGSARHSSPYPYTQDVPLVLYGPRFVRSGVISERAVTLADLAPTYAELMDFDDFPARDGAVLDEALFPAAERPIPRLIVTLVWDGGGDNVLEWWPDAWPNLRDLASSGTHYARATVGHSPSITPAVHATIGTGAFPDVHGMSDRYMRIDGRIVDAWEGEDPLYPIRTMSPRHLEVATLADLWDEGRQGLPEIGVLAWESWHVGMIGHGAFLPGGDKDIAAVHAPDSVEFITNPDYYSLPPELVGIEGLEDAARAVDARDGQRDGRWLGEPLVPISEDLGSTPAWPIYQTQRIVDVLEGAEFGADGGTDLFFTNYKTTDLAGHAWGISSPEVRDVLVEQDRQLAEFVEALDRMVGRGRYVLALTADHGMAERPEETGRWPIDPAEVTRDVNEHFADGQAGLIAENRGVGLFLDSKETRRLDVDAGDIASFLRDYRLGDNATAANPVSGRYTDLEDRPVFALAATSSQLHRALRCARAR